MFLNLKTMSSLLVERYAQLPYVITLPLLPYFIALPQLPYFVISQIYVPEIDAGEYGEEDGYVMVVMQVLWNDLNV